MVFSSLIPECTILRLLDYSICIFFDQKLFLKARLYAVLHFLHIVFFSVIKLCQNLWLQRTCRRIRLEMISRNLQIKEDAGYLPLTLPSSSMLRTVAGYTCSVFIRLRARRIRSVQNPFLQVIQRRVQSTSGREFEGRPDLPHAMLSRFCRSQSSGPSSPHLHGWVLYSMCTSASDQYRRSHSCDNSYLPRCCHFSACIYAQSGCMPPLQHIPAGVHTHQRYLSVEFAALIQMMCQLSPHTD